MIFYFTGTGNSLFAAKRLLSEGEQLVNIADALKEDKLTYEVQEGEQVGFVFPVYFYSLPFIIKDFIGKLSLEGADYIYSVITCGGGIGQAGASLSKVLGKKGLKLSFVRELLMPDNSMLFYQIPGSDKASDRLEPAEVILKDIKKDISERKVSKIGSSTLLSNILGAAYKASSGTAKFYADESCIGCGLCARRCPESVIEISGGKPVWKEKNCCKCSACINRCPKQAIQYGKGTKKRNRYVNPEIQ